MAQIDNEKIQTIQEKVDRCFKEFGNDNSNIIIFSVLYRPDEELEQCDIECAYDLIWGEGQCKNLIPVGLSYQTEKYKGSEKIRDLYLLLSDIETCVDKLTDINGSYFDDYLEHTKWNGCLAITKDLKIYSIIRQVEPKLLNKNQPVLIMDLLADE